MKERDVREANEIDMDFAPATGANLPFVTMNMLLDFLANEEIVYKPESTQRIFRWFSAMSHSKINGKVPSNVEDAHLLFVCSEDDIESLLSEKPQAFAIVLCNDADAFLSSRVFREHAEKIIVVNKVGRFAFFLFQLQSYFTQILVWQDDLDRIVMHDGSLTEALDTSVAVLKNFMFVSDKDLNLVAYTTTVEPPDELHRHIIQTGCLTTQMIDEQRRRLPEKTYYFKPPSEVSPYARLSWPLYLDHTYLGSVSMSCNKAAPTEGLKDLMGILTKRIMPLCKKLWQTQMNIEAPHSLFFKRMIDHVDASKEYIQTQMESAGLDDDTEYKLIALEIDTNTEPERATAVSQSATKINGGNVFCFPYHDMLIALCHTPPSDSGLSHRKTIRDLQQYVYEPYGINSGVSEVFVRIEDLDLAYRQTRIALGLKNTIAGEAFTTEQDEAMRGIYFFANALMYYLVDPSDKDSRFMRFCFDHSILTKLYKDDNSNNTNYLALFWFYLYYGRNATNVANRLHMHRNTVLYHIEKIEERFDVDLSWRIARDRFSSTSRLSSLRQTTSPLRRSFRMTKRGL